MKLSRMKHLNQHIREGDIMIDNIKNFFIPQFENVRGLRPLTGWELYGNFILLLVLNILIILTILILFLKYEKKYLLQLEQNQHSINEFQISIKKEKIKIRNKINKLKAKANLHDLIRK